MGVASVLGLIDCASVEVDTFGSAPGLWRTWAGVVLLALANGCTAAPIAGKPCPCVDGSQYTCCETTMKCLADAAACPPPPPAICESSPLNNTTITYGGVTVPASPDAGTDTAVMFGAGAEQWVSYVYKGTAETRNPSLEVTSDGNGFHVQATFEAFAGDATQAFQGAGLSFVPDMTRTPCIDGSDQTGVQFDFDGNVSQLLMGVVSIDDLSTMFSRGTCTLGMMCFGPMASFIPTIGTNRVPFNKLMGGLPQTTLDVRHIVNVQWQVPAAGKPSVDFTISNVKFYRDG